MKEYRNPIIPGFHPDPSICRVGEDYYLVNSSFEFYPGVPLWHSRDLVNWEQIGHVLTRESQLSMLNIRTSGGIYAPTIRYHNGRFYMITTNVTGMGNFFVWTDDIRGEWSDPVLIDHHGIDPSLFWDDDGKVYYTGTGPEYGIHQFEIDLETGEKLSETKIIWEGTGGKCPEGPHMYKINGWYYLMIAEGGTEYGHMETIARSKSVWGPFESCPHNPIVSYRDDGNSEFQGGGHADIFTDTDGQWWIVFHAIRPSIFMLHHIGRETILAPLTWDENGWPVVNGGKSVSAKMCVPGEGVQEAFCSWRDDFSTETLHPRWSWVYAPDRSKYSFKNGLTLTGSKDTLSDIGSPTFLGTRQVQFDMDYETTVRIKEGVGAVGITVFHTKDHHYDLLVKKSGSGLAVQLRRHAADMEVRSRTVLFENTDTLTLRMDARRMGYTFFAGKDAAHLMEIGKGSSQMLSTEMMICTFTGCFAGMFAEGNVKAEFAYFSAEEK